jgi:hypothetical protein
MNFKNPNSATLQSTVLLFLGITVGAMASRAVVGALHTPTEGADAATAKKESNNLKLKRVGIVAASGYGASSVSGNDTTSQLLKGLGYGMATMQTIDLVKDVAATSPKIATANKAIQQAVGLACPCDTPTIPMYAMNGAGRRNNGRSLRAVITPDFNAVNNSQKVISY